MRKVFRRLGIDYGTLDRSEGVKPRQETSFFALREDTGARLRNNYSERRQIEWNGGK